MFYSLMFFFSFNNYLGLRYIQLSLGNRVVMFFWKSCQLSLPSVHFVAGQLYFPLVLEATYGSECISSWVHLFTSLTYFETINNKGHFQTFPDFLLILFFSDRVAICYMCFHQSFKFD